MKFLLLLVSLVILPSCGRDENKSAKVRYVEFSEDQKIGLVNQGELNINTQIQSSVSLVEEEYGIMLSMFKDHKFYYKITGIGEGAGFWKYNEKGYFHLHANYSRSPSGLNFFIINLDESGENLDVLFDDRFGVQRRSVTVINDRKNKG